MTPNEIQAWIELNPEFAFVGVLGISLLVFIFARIFIAHGLVYLAERTESKYDDIIVAQLRPYRFAWIAPLVILYNFVYLLPTLESVLQKTILFLVLWIVIFTVDSLLGAFNTIYESRESFTGVAIQGYLDMLQLLFIIVGLILSVSIITGESPLVLLTGLGALTAVLLLLFRDTLLSLVASIQISANNLIKEGDWVEIPAFGIDGDVMDITLNSIKFRNFDKTISVLPTYKLLETSFKNWRGMSESGGRRIKRALNIEISSIGFCDRKMIQKFKKIQLIKEYIETKEQEIKEYNQANEIDDKMLVNGRHLTNIGTFRAYILAYLRSRPDIHQEGMTLMVRQLAPTITGVPLELYLFTKITGWAPYENIQADIFDHLLSVAPEFGLRVFQQPSGHDFAKLGK